MVGYIQHDIVISDGTNSFKFPQIMELEHDEDISNHGAKLKIVLPPIRDLTLDTFQEGHRIETCTFSFVETLYDLKTKAFSENPLPPHDFSGFKVEKLGASYPITVYCTSSADVLKSFSITGKINKGYSGDMVKRAIKLANGQGAKITEGKIDKGIKHEAIQVNGKSLFWVLNELSSKNDIPFFFRDKKLHFTTFKANSVLTKVFEFGVNILEHKLTYQSGRKDFYVIVTSDGGTKSKKAVSTSYPKDGAKKNYTPITRRIDGLTATKAAKRAKSIYNDLSVTAYAGYFISIGFPAVQVGDKIELTDPERKDANGEPVYVLCVVERVITRLKGKITQEIHVGNHVKNTEEDDEDKKVFKSRDKKKGKKKKRAVKQKGKGRSNKKKSQGSAKTKRQKELDKLKKKYNGSQKSKKKVSNRRGKR